MLDYFRVYEMFWGKVITLSLDLPIDNVKYFLYLYEIILTVIYKAIIQFLYIHHFI